jgi:hypothetical protein
MDDWSRTGMPHSAFPGTLRESFRAKRLPPRPPALTFAFLRFPPPNFFFELGKSQGCRVGCPRGQKRRGGQ